MNIQQLINEKLIENVDKHGCLVAFNKIGNRMTLYGYMHEVGPDFIIWKDNETGDKFKIRNVISFKEVKIK